MKQGHYWYPRPDAFIVSVSISNRLSWAADPDLTLLASALNLTLTLVSVATSNSAVLSSSWGLIVNILLKSALQSLKVLIIKLNKI